MARPVVVPSPGATIELRRTDACTGVTVTVTGEMGHGDAAVLSRCLHAELDALPSVVVVDVRGVTRRGRTYSEVLEVARTRARCAGIGMHVLDALPPVDGGRVGS